MDVGADLHPHRQAVPGAAVKIVQLSSIALLLKLANLRLIAVAMALSTSRLPRFSGYWMET
jgi:hypothetical protein